VASGVTMTLLATVNTDVGHVELRCEDGRFTTSCTHVGRLDGAARVCIILITAARAHWWYGLAERRGAVFAPFPPAVAS